MIERLYDIVQQRSKQAPAEVMLAAKENGNWRTYSCSEVWQSAQKLAGGLLSQGIDNQVLEPEQQEKIAIISPPAGVDNYRRCSATHRCGAYAYLSYHQPGGDGLCVD